MKRNPSTMLIHNAQEPVSPAFYSDTTLSDSSSMPVIGGASSTALRTVKKDRRWTRRAFLGLGGIVLAGGGISAGYVMSHPSAFNSFSLLRSTMAPSVRPSRHQSTPVKQTLPAKIEAILSFTQHQQAVRSLAWSPGGKLLASGANDLLIWGTNGDVQVRLQQAAHVHAIAWTPDGQQLATGVANQVTFLDPFTGKTFASFTLSPTAEVTSLAWSPRQPPRLVSGALDNQAIVWDAITYRPQTRFTRHTTPIEAVSWAADGQTVGTSSFGGVVRVWNAADGQELHGLFSDAQVPMRTLAFAPFGGQLAVGGEDGLVRLWNGLSCQMPGQGKFGDQCQDIPQILRGHTRAVRSLGWSSDGTLLATGSDDGTLAIWSPMQRTSPIFTIQHKAPVVALSWSPTGGQIATAAENTITLWRLS